MKRALKRINKEYEDFRKEVLLLSKEEIFEEVFTIHFYIDKQKSYNIYLKTLDKYNIYIK